MPALVARRFLVPVGFQNSATGLDPGLLRGSLVFVEETAEVPDLLGGPRPVRVGGDPEDVRIAGADFHHEQAVQAPEGHWQSTWKKSVASVVAACACRNCRQVVSVRRLGAGGIRDALRTRRIVDAPGADHPDGEPAWRRRRLPMAAGGAWGTKPKAARNLLELLTGEADRSVLVRASPQGPRSRRGFITSRSNSAHVLLHSASGPTIPSSAASCSSNAAS